MRTPKSKAALASLALALCAATSPAHALRVQTYAVYYQGTSNHCEVHFGFGSVVDFGAMPLSWCQSLVNALN